MGCFHYLFFSYRRSVLWFLPQGRAILTLVATDDSRFISFAAESWTSSGPSRWKRMLPPLVSGCCFSRSSKLDGSVSSQLPYIRRRANRPRTTVFAASVSDFLEAAVQGTKVSTAASADKAPPQQPNVDFILAGARMSRFGADHLPMLTSLATAV